jgi:MspA
MEDSMSDPVQLAANRKPQRQLRHTSYFATAVSVVATLLMAGTQFAGGARAWAEPADPSVGGTQGPVPIPSSPPSTAKSTDRWTLTLTANSETMTPAAPLNPASPPREFIVSGLFNGTLRNPYQSTRPTPSGKIEAGYEIQCVPSGLLAALKPAAVNVEVVEDDFEGADPSVAITNYRVHVDCMGPAVIRSYAILTRTTDGADAVVAYYGVPQPV